MEGGQLSPAAAARRYRAGNGDSPYRRIAYALVAPEDRTEVAEIAERVMRRRIRGLGALRDPESALLAQLLGTSGRGAELLSFLLFDEVFVERLLQAGREAAERWLAAYPGMWRSQAEELSGFDDTGLQEEGALTEFRSLWRRT